MRSFIKKSWPFFLLAALSFILHFAFLNYPSQVVFDEVHFGKFVAAYSTGQYYFDIHPPLGKLMIAGMAKLAGVNPVFSFEKIGEQIPDNILLTLRFLPAFFGALLALLFSWLAYLISKNKFTALLAGFLILMDNAFLGESKFILVDTFLFFFEILTLCFFFLWQKQKSFSAKWFFFLILTGLAAGLTFSIKWTGLAIIGIIGIVLLTKIFSQKLSSYLESDEKQRSILVRFKEAFIGSLLLLVIAFCVYLLPFYYHFKLLPNSGPGDAFMSQAFQQELRYGRDNIYQPLTFWQKFTELNKSMFSANASLTAQHAFSSRWYSWPVNIRPVYYWEQTGANGHDNWQAKIYLSGNPVLWWLAGLGIIITLLTAASKKSRRQLEPIFYVLLLGYFANLLPFIFINRAAFLYHYLPSLLFAFLILALWLTRLWQSKKTFFLIAAGFILFGFILLSPITYGWSLPPLIGSLETNIMRLFN